MENPRRLFCLLLLIVVAASLTNAQGGPKKRIKLRPRITTTSPPRTTVAEETSSSTDDRTDIAQSADKTSSQRAPKAVGVPVIRRRQGRRIKKKRTGTGPRRLATAAAGGSVKQGKANQPNRFARRQNSNSDKTTYLNNGAVVIYGSGSTASAGSTESSSGTKPPSPRVTYRRRNPTSSSPGGPRYRPRSSSSGSAPPPKSRSSSRRRKIASGSSTSAGRTTSSSLSASTRQREGARVAIKRRIGTKRRLSSGSQKRVTRPNPVTVPSVEELERPTTPAAPLPFIQPVDSPRETSTAASTTSTPLFEPTTANAPPPASSRAPTTSVASASADGGYPVTSRTQNARTRPKASNSRQNTSPAPTQIESLVQGLLAADLSLSSSQASASAVASQNVFRQPASDRPDNAPVTPSSSPRRLTPIPNPYAASFTESTSSTGSEPSSYADTASTGSTSSPPRSSKARGPTSKARNNNKRRGRPTSTSSRAQIAYPKGVNTVGYGWINTVPKPRQTPGIAPVSLQHVPSQPVGKATGNWSATTPTGPNTVPGKFLPGHIDPFLCTHIVFAFSSMTNNRLSPFESNDISQNGKPGLYKQVTGLKEINPKLKVMLAIGGWSFGTKKFKAMSGNLYNRRTFVYSVAPYLREKNFDGLDLDWEYPKGGTDKENFAELCRELREAFEEEARETGQERLLLTAAVPVGPDSIRAGYDVAKLARYLDLFHIMAYDFHGKWERQTGHNAPLNAPSSDSTYRKQLSVNASLHMWMSLGAPKHKLVVGMPTYGRSFTLSNPAKADVNAPARGGGREGRYTKEEGFLAYYEICEKLYNGAEYVWDDEMSVPYMVEGNQWVGFDDEKAIRIKMNFINDMDLAGAMVWSVDMDDFAAAACGGAQYPLMTAMREELFDIPRQDNKKDIDWSRVAKRRAVPAPIPPSYQQLTIADLLALLKERGIEPDPRAIQMLQGSLGTTQIATAGSPALAAQPIDDNLAPPKVFCYVTSWSRDRPSRGRFSPSDLDPLLCTHVVWAFAPIENGALRLPTGNEDSRDPASDYQQLLRLREAKPGLQLLLAVGGSAVDPSVFQSLTSSGYRMNNFIYDAVDFIRKMELDGIDLHWEYPSGSEDRLAHAKLIREFRLAFDSEASAKKKPRLILTTALPGDVELIYDGYDIPEISQHVDFLNMMAIDMHGSWDDKVGHNAPLYPLESASRDEERLSVDRAVRELIREGAPAEKTLLGISTYGRTFQLKDTEKYDIGAEVVGGGKEFRFTQQQGFAAFFEVCDFLDRDNTTLIWDDEQQVPFAFSGDQWVGFDDEKSVALKVEWLREAGLGGVMLWAADLDDYRGSCGNGPYPLLHAVQDALEEYRVPYTYAGGPAKPAFGAAPIDPNEVVCENGDGEVTFHRDVLDCTHYYLCQGTTRHHMPCPSDLVFNEAEKVCDWPENVEACWAFTQPPPP